MMLRKWLGAHALPVLGIAVFALGFHACSASGDGDGFSNTGGGNSGGAGGSGATGTGGSGAIFDATPGDGTLTDSSACAATSYDGTLVPLDLYMMLDQSSSMSEAGKWSSVTTAVSTFIGSSEADGIGVGLQYFPLPPSQPIPGACDVDADCGLYGPCIPPPPFPPPRVCSGAFAQDTSCIFQDYDEPEVPIAELPGAQPALAASLGAHGPNAAATPTQPAMEGALIYTTQWAKDHTDHLVYLVFATDGEPTGCTYNNTIDGTATAAATAAADTPPVKTFVIGVGSELGSLNQIAMAGQTDSAFLVDTGANVTQQFIDALNQIRAEGLCQFQIPVPTTGTPDYNKVNVSLIPDDGSAPQTIPKVDSEGACGAAGGWYYDIPANPKKIILCDATCEEVKLSDWDIDILLGCTTVTF